MGSFPAPFRGCDVLPFGKPCAVGDDPAQTRIFADEETEKASGDGPKTVRRRPDIPTVAVPQRFPSFRLAPSAFPAALKNVSLSLITACAGNDSDSVRAPGIRLTAVPIAMNSIRPFPSW